MRSACGARPEMRLGALQVMRPCVAPPPPLPPLPAAIPLAPPRAPASLPALQAACTATAPAPAAARPALHRQAAAGLGATLLLLSAAASAPAPALAADLALGREVFQANCGVCCALPATEMETSWGPCALQQAAGLLPPCTPAVAVAWLLPSTPAPLPCSCCGHVLLPPQLPPTAAIPPHPTLPTPPQRCATPAG